LKEIYNKDGQSVSKLNDTCLGNPAEEMVHASVLFFVNWR